MTIKSRKTRLKIKIIIGAALSLLFFIGYKLNSFPMCLVFGAAIIAYGGWIRWDDYAITDKQTHESEAEFEKLFSVFLTVDFTGITEKDKLIKCRLWSKTDEPYYKNAFERLAFILITDIFKDKVIRARYEHVNNICLKKIVDGINAGEIEALALVRENSLSQLENEITIIFKDIQQALYVGNMVNNQGMFEEFKETKITAGCNVCFEVFMDLNMGLMTDSRLKAYALGQRETRFAVEYLMKGSKHEVVFTVDEKYVDALKLQICRITKDNGFKGEITTKRAE